MKKLQIELGKVRRGLIRKFRYTLSFLFSSTRVRCPFLFPFLLLPCLSLSDSTSLSLVASLYERPNMNDSVEENLITLQTSSRSGK